MTNRKPSAFTIMEILVATTLFAFTSVALTVLFNYTLKINRRAEALRQASQDTLNFVETIAKEVRNGQIDYDVLSGSTIETQNIPCPIPAALGAKSYQVPDNRLGIVDVSGNRWCFYLGNSQGNYVGQGIFTGKTVALVKMVGGTQEPVQVLNPPNETVSSLVFFVQPICDPYTLSPYCADYGNVAPKIQPVVTILATFTVKLPTGETVSIPYQTTVSTDRYDVPNSP